MDGIDITQIHLEQVKSFKYLGSFVNGNNLIEEEIKERISLGNRAYYANQDLFKSKLLTRNSKLQMYKTLVLQTYRVTDGNWTFLKWLVGGSYVR